MYEFLHYSYEKMISIRFFQNLNILLVSGISFIISIFSYEIFFTFKIPYSMDSSFAIFISILENSFYIWNLQHYLLAELQQFIFHLNSFLSIYNILLYIHVKKWFYGYHIYLMPWKFNSMYIIKTKILGKIAIFVKFIKMKIIFP